MRIEKTPHFTVEATRRALNVLARSKMPSASVLRESVLIQQLDALGLLAESAPDLAHALTEEFTSEEKSTMNGVACRVSFARICVIGERLDAAESRRDLLQTLPTLSAYPQEAEQLQHGVHEALWAREGVHRLGFALEVLDPTHVGAARNEAVDRLDERLLALLPALSRLAAVRSVAAAGLPAEHRDAHWWFSHPADDDLDDSPLSADEAPELKAVSRFLAERTEWTERGPKVRLSAEEHRRLAASEAGLALLNANADVIDVEG